MNAGKPILLGIDVAEQGGVRDPHIARGPDNAFYRAWDDISRDRGTFVSWVDEHILGTDDYAGYRTSLGLDPVGAGRD